MSAVRVRVGDMIGDELLDVTDELEMELLLKLDTIDELLELVTIILSLELLLCVVGTTLLELLVAILDVDKLLLLSASFTLLTLEELELLDSLSVLVLPVQPCIAIVKPTIITICKYLSIS